MSELTREYLDKKLDKLTTKDDLKKLEVNLKSHTEKEVAGLATMVAKGFADVDKRFDKLEKKFDLHAEVNQLKIQMSKVWDVLNIASK